jgi:CHAT domain-containing protein/Flp pilus assembly protein TadD
MRTYPATKDEDDAARFRFCCLILVLALMSGQARAQTPLTTPSPQNSTSSTAVLTANDVLTHAKQLYSREGAKAALPEYEKALALFRQDGDKKGEAITLGLMGNCYKKLGDFPKAEDYLQRALAMKRTVGDRLEEAKTLSNLGLLHWDMSDYKAAADYLHQSIAIAQELRNRVMEAAARNNLGLVFDDVGDYRHSLEEYNHSLALYREEQSQLGTNDTIESGMGDAIGNLGGDHLLLGDYAEALKSYQQALIIDQRLKAKPKITLDLQNIGLAHTGLGRYTDALEALDQSIALAREAGLKKEEADSHKAKGSVLLQLGRYDDARKEYQTALHMYEQAQGLKQSLIEGLGDVGNLDLRLGDSASAEKEYRRALEVSRAINHPRGITFNLIALGDIEWRRKHFNEAAELYQEAITRAIEAKDKGAEASARIQLALTLRSLNRLEEAAKESQVAVEIARTTQARVLETEALYAQAEIARSAVRHDEALKLFTSAKDLAVAIRNPELSWRIDFGRGQSLEALNRDEDAHTAYQEAIKTIEQVRGELSEERFRAGYIEDKYQVYVALVQLLLKMGKPDEAFVVSEKLRARSYLDLLNRGEPPLRNESQRQKEIELRNRLRDLQHQVDEESGKPQTERKGDAFDLYSKELSSAERDYENFLDDLLSSDNAYANARALKVPSREEVQRQLQPDTALIEYVLGEDNLEIFFLTPAQLRAKSVPVRASELQSRVEFLRDVLQRKNTDDWRPPAESLYRVLIGPIEQAGWLRDVKRLYIVPHASLHYLPFAVLSHGVSTRSGSDAMSASLSRSVKGRLNDDRLLIDDYTIAYLPAAAALVYGGQPNTSNQSVLAMSPASTRLRYAQQESQDVSNLFQGQRMLLLGKSATESSFKQLADRYDVIHLATHGFFNKMNPLLSGVTLEADAQNDGRLEVHEILGLRLKAKLVTLSACDTALGSGYFEEIPAGDDLVGLTRAFLFAGSPTVVASLWEVNDLASVRLMDDFYRQLNGRDKADALANAQRAMRARGPYRHPYYWSAFVMVGQMK